MIKEFNTRFGTDVAHIRGVYDHNRRHYWVSDGTSCWVFDDRFGCWISNYQFTDLYDGLFAYNDLYVLGRDASNNLKVYKMYSGAYNSLFGRTVTPSVEFSINPEYEFVKTYDNVDIYASDKLDLMDIRVEKETGASGQEALAMDIEVNRREGNYRIAVVRDANSARLRGVRAVGKVYWKTTDAKVSLSQVVTKYRTSERLI